MTTAERTTKTHANHDGSTVEVPADVEIGYGVKIGDESLISAQRENVG